MLLLGPSNVNPGTLQNWVEGKLKRVCRRRSTSFGFDDCHFWTWATRVHSHYKAANNEPGPVPVPHHSLWVRRKRKRCASYPQAGRDMEWKAQDYLAAAIGRDPPATDLKPESSAGREEDEGRMQFQKTGGW